MSAAPGNVDAVKLLSDALNAMESIAKAYRDGRKYLKSRHPDCCGRNPETGRSPGNCRENHEQARLRGREPVSLM